VRLETERLILRKPDPGDRDAYAELWGDPEVVRYLGHGRTLPPAEAPAAIDAMLAHWERYGVGLFSVVRREDERMIGRTGFLMWDPERWVHGMREDLTGDLETEIGWTFGRAYWGQGYATEAAVACRDLALGELGLSRLVSLIAHGNIASVRVAEKIGEALEREELPGPFVRRVDLYSLGKRPAR
jgi:RimJ/RimL family protein N-acetyltransferase